MKSLQESMREAENKKRMLEESVDALREECAKLKAAEQVRFYPLLKGDRIFLLWKMHFYD